LSDAVFPEFQNLCNYSPFFSSNVFYSKLTPDEFFSKCNHVLCSAEYRQLENDNARELWDNEKSILLKKVAKLLDSRKRVGRVEEERLQPETKGQIISEGNFGVFKSPKKQSKFFEGFLP
jgi:hypothetical protein